MKFSFRLFMENAGFVIICLALFAGAIALICLACATLPAWFMNTGLFVIAGLTIGLIFLEILSKF